VFILGFLVVVVGGSLLLYAWRAPKVRSGSQLSPVLARDAAARQQRAADGGLRGGAAGHLYPLFMDALGGGKISVGPPYFNAIFAPLAAGSSCS
jgi:cytochrome c-type biogenesis protein CcmF